MTLTAHPGVETGRRPRSPNAHLFRAVNERIRELAVESLAEYSFMFECDNAEYSFMCECDDETCTQVVHMTVEEYDALRQTTAAFAVLSGHEQRDDEVVGRGENHVVVHKADGGPDS